MWNSKKVLILDTEGSGLYNPKLQKKPDNIWCATGHSIQSGKTTHFNPTQIKSLPSYLKNFDYICGHNLMGYDRPLIRDLLGYEIPHENCIDTWCMSALCNSLRPSHSVDSYGQQFQHPKPQHEDWSQYSDAMKHRNMEDVVIQTKMFKLLSKEFNSLKIPIEELMTEQRIAAELFETEWYGFPFNSSKAFDLLEFFHDRQKVVEDELRTILPKRFKPRGGVYDWSKDIWTKVSTKEAKYTRDGQLSRTNVGWISRDQCQEEFSIGEAWTEVDTLPWDFKSRPFLVHSLKHFGAEFKHHTNKGMPETGEESLEFLWKTQKIYPAKLLLEYLMLQKRIQDLSKWIEEASPLTESIHGKIFFIGTRTHRMSHSNPPLTQATSLKKPFGPELRELFHTPHEDTCIVGTDASGIQGRILGHYTGSKDYIKILTEGDIHKYNCDLMGFDHSRRSDLKTFYYAWILGCGFNKAAEILSITPEEAKEKMNAFVEGTPGMQEMLDKYSKLALSGQVRSELSGRVFPIRFDKTQGYGNDKRVWHGEWLSSFLQGDESAIMKRAFIKWRNKLDELRVPHKLLYWNHDEWQTLCHCNDATLVGRVQVQSIVDAGKDYNCKCPLTGEWIMGYNWRETH